MSTNFTFNYEKYLSALSRVRFEEFLHTSQTGFAHTLSGTDISTLAKTVATSMALCTIQLTFFCILRPILKSIYQPRSYCVPLNERMNPLPDGFFSWIIPTLSHPIGYYYLMGLDAYFFVRFISVLLLFFVIVGSLNMLILLPINWTGSSSDHQALGMDKFSLSNISNANVSRLNSHFIMSVLTIGILHWLVLYELKSYVNIRQSYLMTTQHRTSIISKTLLISSVPDHLKNLSALKDAFKSVPGGVKRAWNVYDFTEIKYWVDIANESLQVIEQSQTMYQANYYRKQFPPQYWWKKTGSEDKLEIYMQNHEAEEIEYDPTLEEKFYPKIHLPPYKISFIDRTIRVTLPGWLRIFALQKRSIMSEWATERMTQAHKEIDQLKQSMIDNVIGTYDKAFIEFETQLGASIALQCLLSQSPKCLEFNILEPHPADIVWSNLARSNQFVCQLEKYMVTLAFVAIIVLYVVPVSFIGMVSQIPLMTQLIPFLRWIYKLPEDTRRTISSVIPSILLTLLTEMVMVTFRFLTHFKGKMNGCEIELSLQKWYFAFLFVQQFLVVTILSSITVILRQIVDEPTSIPFLLAMNIPKAATFFFQYLTIKTFAFCGSNFLRIDQLVKTILIHSWHDDTPRKKFNRLATLPKVRWGTVYPVYLVYACIGVVYCTISPLISLFVSFMLILALVYFKYALKFIYSHVDKSQTHGRLYPTALLYLYTGIYCLECCLIGIFFLLRNENGSSVMRPQGYIMCIVLLATIFAQMQLYYQNVRHFEYSPIIYGSENKDALLADACPGEDDGNEYYLSKEMLYLHPAFKYEFPRLWLAADPLGVSDSQIKRIESQVSSLKGGMTRGAVVDFKSCYRKFKIQVLEAPPDFK